MNIDKHQDIRAHLFTLSQLGSAASGTAVRMLEKGLNVPVGTTSAALLLRCTLESMRREIDFLIPYLMDLEEENDEPEPETCHG